ncbi:MAG: hypothetical protein LH679_00795 [Cyanobacteria bacterium CAN_BIN43]|jgi:hypothetical protein|nr:hypothetical protein [Cyanobacteria bacterium CAN_BIN43]
MISEVFCELDFEDAEEARRRRNQRILELQDQGMTCTAENLYHVDGNQVYLLTAEVINPQWQRGEDYAPRLKDKNARPTRYKAKFEIR